MDYEKAYMNALKWARGIYPKAAGAFKEDLEHYFPELAESEDERIRKAIVEFFESQDDNTTYSFIPKKDILAWLERQGQKPFDYESATIVQKDFAPKTTLEVGEWLLIKLDKTYEPYGIGKMMELTQFNGYDMLDAIEHGYQYAVEKVREWLKEQQAEL